MHELSLIQQIIEAIILEAKKNGLQSIEEVTITYHPLEGWDREILSEHMEEFKLNTVLNNTIFHFVSSNGSDGITIAEIKGKQ